MYPKKQPKSDREKFYGAFQKKVGCKPEQYLRRKLAGGMPEAELRRLYDMLAVEIAMKAKCTAIRYDALQLEPAGETAAERHTAARPRTRSLSAHAAVGAWCCAPGRPARARDRNSGAAPTTRPAGIRRTLKRGHEKFQVHHQL